MISHARSHARTAVLDLDGTLAEGSLAAPFAESLIAGGVCEPAAGRAALLATHPAQGATPGTARGTSGAGLEVGGPAPPAGTAYASSGHRVLVRHRPVTGTTQPPRPGQSGAMRTHRTAIVLAAAGLLALTGCSEAVTSEPKPDAKPVSSPSAAPTTTAAATPAPVSSKPAAPATTPPAAPAPAPAEAAVPNGVGQVLQTAQDNAQAAGFFLLGSTDALGQSRMQVLDRNWKVCSQAPTAGTKAATSTKIVFNTVKLEETCP